MANDIFVFWIIFNSADLQCPLVIRFTSIELEFLNKIQSAFQHNIATMNLVAVAKFFYIIYNAIFMSLFGANQITRGLFGPISNYFAIVKINGYRMFYLYCLVWLKDVSHLVTL